jgi:hypothetical protein
MAEDRVRVLRVLEYEGPRSWVETTLDKRAVKGAHAFSATAGNCVIREAMVGEVPVILAHPDPFPAQAMSGHKIAPLTKESNRPPTLNELFDKAHAMTNRNRKPEEWR